jgi:hypothetical protein
MSGGKRYLLDANIFIQAQQTYYGLDMCPGFWSALVREHGAKRGFSIDKVKAELVVIEDALSDWVKNKAPPTLFKGTADRHVADLLRDLLTWVEGQPQFTPAAKAEFADAADGWVIAYAKVNGLVVVTHEELAPGAKKKVPIPNVCVQFGVEYCNTFTMLRDLKAQFILKQRKSTK